MSSNSSTAPPPRPAPSPPPKRSPSPSHSTAPPPSADSSSPSPSRPSDSSPPPAASRFHGAPAKPHSPRGQSSRGSGDGARSPPAAPAHRGGATMLEIVFAAAGAAALLVILIAACVCCSRKTAPRRRKRPHNPMHYCADSSSSVCKGKGQPVMDWSTRLRIALGSAKGLAYLHEDCHPRIIHRDIKSANILLDDNFEAKVADFGLAKLTSDNNTHVSTRVMGTFGYLAPEYASSGKLTDKSDVFSYGVMLLELLTGRRPIDDADAGGTAHPFLEDSLVDWARPALSRALADGDYDGVADPRLRGNYDPVEMARMVASAAAAVRHSAKKRPKMSQIVRALEGDMSLEDLNEGVRPGQSMASGTAVAASYKAKAPGPYTSDMERIRQAPTASPVYSGAAIEFGRPSTIASEGSFCHDLSPEKGQPHR